MTTDPNEIREYARENGPILTCEAYNLRLPGFVQCVTGLGMHGRNRDLDDAVSSTNGAEKAYREFGLATVKFPTFFHTLEMGRIKERETGRKNYYEMLDREERRLLEKLPEVQEDERKGIQRELSWVRGSRRSQQKFERSMESLSSSAGVYNPGGLHNAENAMLVGQWEDEGRVHEVYTAGDCTIAVRQGGTLPRLYFAHVFDEESGELLRSSKLPYSATGCLLGSLQMLAYIATMSLSAVLINVVSVPAKRSLERTVLEKAQENWEENKS